MRAIVGAHAFARCGQAARWMRASSASQTGVNRWAAAADRQVDAAFVGLWKSLPREAQQVELAAVPA
jgi:hypothetical protein